MKVRVGFGYDVHKLVEGRPLILGGVLVPSEVGALGHSDADVVIHAIMDALLGAAGMRDIGTHFPDSDASLKNIDSKILLQRTFQLIKKQGFTVGNVDVTICLEAPKIARYVPEMKVLIGKILEINSGDVSIKATTSEGLGFAGRLEGLCSYAVAVLYNH